VPYERLGATHSIHASYLLTPQLTRALVVFEPHERIFCKPGVLRPAYRWPITASGRVTKANMRPEPNASSIGWSRRPLALDASTLCPHATAAAVCNPPPPVMRLRRASSPAARIASRSGQSS